MINQNILASTTNQSSFSIPSGNVIQIDQVTGIIGIVTFIFVIGVAWGTIATKIGHIASTIKDKIEPDLKDVRERFASLEGKSASLFGASSPIALLDKGREVLEKSGLKKYIEDNKDVLLKKFGEICPMQDQYDIQEKAFKFFDELDFKEFEQNIKKASFDLGVNINTIRRIGGIYFRDIALDMAKFKPEDLDKPKPNSN